jgi:hypothetical protein
MEDESKFYRLPTQSLPGLNFSDQLADVVKIKEFLDGRSIQTKNTRIERYIQYLTEYLSEGPMNESSVFKNSVDGRFKSSTDWLLYVLREIHELMWIFQGLKVHIPAGLDGRLEMLVNGSDFAALDTNLHCRNVQFELRIASYFCHAGCVVDLTTNTDVIALNEEFAFFVECKRIGSMTQFQRRLAEAAKQLHRRMPQTYEKRIAYGCIAADVTKAAFTHNGLTWALTSEHSRDINQKKLTSIANTLMNVPLFAGSRNLIQYWLQIHIPCHIMHPPTVITRFSSYYIQNAGTDRMVWSALKALHDISGIANKRDEREIPSRPLIRRTKLTLPPGTKFQVVEENLLRELLVSGRVIGKKDDDVVAALTLNGFKHEFIFSELEMLVVNSSEAELKSMAENVTEVRLEVVLKMYMLRYPYENIEKDGQTLKGSGNLGAKNV